MLRNYLLTAYKVLLRRKFFTFVNLFAIALTLAVLTVVIALLQNYTQPLGVEHRSDHYLAVERAMLAGEKREETSSPGFRMIEQHFLPLKEPDLIGFFRKPNQGTVFLEGRKLTPDVAGTDANYWKILDFQFLAGRSISEQDVEEGRPVAVLNRKTSQEMFGSLDSLGQTFVANGQRFEVIGVVEDVPALRPHGFSEIWVPYSASTSNSYRREWTGTFTVLLFAEDKTRLPAIQQEAWESFDSFVHEDPKTYQRARAPADSKLGWLARQLLDRRWERESQSGVLVIGLILAMLGFMLLPSINLINLNVSRILERAPEIGIRKAFGASSGDLVRQFLVENLVLTLLGGILGFFLGLLFLSIVETSGMIPYADFQIDLRVFGFCLAAMTIFGILSGVFPAYKMAKFNPVKALRGG